MGTDVREVHLAAEVQRAGQQYCVTSTLHHPSSRDGDTPQSGGGEGGDRTQSQTASNNVSTPNNALFFFRNTNLHFASLLNSLSTQGVALTK